MILILVAMLPTVPLSHGSLHTPNHPQLSTYSSQTNMDPNATLSAFNYTYAQADLYTNSSKGFSAISTLPPYAHLSWLQTVPRTSTGGLVPGSAFNFNVTQPTAPGREVVNWTLLIPQFNCQGCSKTEIRFNFFGNLTKGTSASYSLYNGTIPVSLANVPGNNTSTFSGQQVPTTGCPQPNVCVNATKFIGFNLTLTFHLGWNSTAVAMTGGMSVDVGELVVTSVDQTFKKSSSNFMLATNSTTITHQANFRSIAYNGTVSYHRAGSSAPPLLNHTWTTEILDIYYPAGYQVGKITLNGTTLFQISPHVAFDTEPCFDRPTCSTSLLALNMSDFFKASTNSTVVVKMTSPNSVSFLNTLTSGVPVSQFLPGEGLTVQVVNKPSAANVTTGVNPRLNVTITDPTGSTSSTSPPPNLANASGGNFTSTVPAGPFGTWTVTVAFVSNYDMGSRSRLFSVEEILMTPNTFGYSGSNAALAAQGTMTYATSNSSILPASNVNGVVFVVDTGIPTTSPVTNTTTSPFSASLYVANVTLVNGVFGQTQTLVTTFTIINPTPSLFSANVTIDHEWSTSQTHGASVTIPLVLGDQPFSTQVSRRYSYEADISFSSTPVQVKLTSLTTLNSRTASMSQGSDPIVPNRQHTGLFKITVKSAVLGSPPGTPSSLESPPYAYIPGLPSFSGRYLTYASFTTRSDGSFSISTTSNSILAAKKLILFALAKDGKGVTLVNGQNPGQADSTILQASLDPISQLTIGQTVQPTLHLTSNASKITEIITVTESLQTPQGSSVVDSHKVTVQPGPPQTVTFTLTAPQTAGSYTVTFSSPEYGGPFASQTVQVSVVSSNLQLLIPAAIGLVAAIIVLGFYLVRRTPEKDMEEKQEKPRPAGPKPKTQPGSGSSTSKSLTQTRDPESR